MKFWPFHKKPRRFSDWTGHEASLRLVWAGVKNDPPDTHETQSRCFGPRWGEANQVHLPKKGDTIKVFMDGWNGGYFKTFVFDGTYGIRDDGSWKATAYPVRG